MGITKVQNCRCLELEERVLKAEENYTDLESELQKRGKEFESLELRFKGLESEKLVVEQELRNLKEYVEDALFDQMMVNRALEVEKHVAEKEAEVWKREFEKLAETVRKFDGIGAFRVGELELDENVKLGLELARNMFPIGTKIESCKAYKEGLSSEGGSPFITTPVKDYMPGRSRDSFSCRRRRVNKRLVFEGDRHKATDASDSETEERNEKESDGKDTLEEKSVGESYEDEDVEVCEANTSTPPSSLKRKWIITSDSENDEDHIPVSILKNMNPPSQEVSDLVDTTSTGEEESRGLRIQRRVSSRLRKQRVLEEVSTSSGINPTDRLVGIPSTGNAEDDETEEEESERESESESLDEFKPRR